VFALFQNTIQGFTLPTPNCSRLLLNLQIPIAMSERAIKLNPVFDDLNKPETFLYHIDELKEQAGKYLPRTFNKFLFPFGNHGRMNFKPFGQFS